jgi:hypothetical protein
MKTIRLTDGDHDRVALLARAWRVSESEVVRRVLDEFAHQSAPTTEASEEVGDGVTIYTDYDGHLVEAVFYPTTKRVDIVSGTLAGRSYRSPSGAARAVVQVHNPSVHPSRNGWLFWQLRKTGKTLETIRIA